MRRGLAHANLTPALAAARASLPSNAARRTFDRLVLYGAAELIALDAANAGEYPTGRRDRATLDAQTLAISARQLEHVMAEVYNEEFPELRGASGDLITIDSSVPEGAETFTYYLYSSVGMARFSSAYSSRTSPRASITGAKVQGNVECIESSYGYTTRDLRNAAFANLPLDSMLGVADRQSHAELLHKTCLWGREDLALPGFLNHPNITTMDAPTGNWPSATVDEIIADVNALVDNAELISFGMRKSNVVLLSRSRYLLLKTTRLGAGDGGMTILKFVQEVHPGVSFEVLNELDPANSDGNLSEHTAVAFTRDPRLVSLIVPMPYRQYPVQQDGLNFVVPTESSTGGVKCPEPQIITRMGGL